MYEVACLGFETVSSRKKEFLAQGLRHRGSPAVGRLGGKFSERPPKRTSAHLQIRDQAA